MDVQIEVEQTPNPNARKFILNLPVKTEGKITYRAADECYQNTLAKDLFTIKGINQVHFFENVITLTQDGSTDWGDVEWLAQAIIETRLPVHDPNFKERPEEKIRKIALTPELQKIEEILDRTIRPGLQGDGGDLDVLGYEAGVLKIRYQGACGSCPSSTTGTLMAIEGILREQFDPNIRLEII